jgi:paraquat-inducible protein B
MSKRSNPTVIGAFVAGAIAIAVIGALVLGGRAWFSRPEPFVMFFDHSVAGLAIGAPVQFRGVLLGTVTDIRAVPGPGQIAVFVGLEVDSHRVFGSAERLSRERLRQTAKEAIARGLRAQLQMQSFVTGQLYVALDFFPDTPVRLTGLDPGVPEVPTVPTTTEQFSEQFRRIVARLEKLPLEQLMNSSIGAVEAVRVLAQSPDLKQSLQGAAVVVNEARTLVRKLNGQVDPLAASARQTLDEARGTVATLKSDLSRVLAELDKHMGPLAAGANETMGVTRALILDTQKLVGQTSEQLAPLVASVTRTSESARGALETARATLEGAQATLANTDAALNEESPLGYQLGEALVQLADAARSLKALADSLEQQPSSVVWGKPSNGRR